MRDHTKLKAFALADRLAIATYRETAKFPSSERTGLQSQVRRAAVSIATNIVEGCARKSETEYARFIEIAFSSSRELQYTLDLSRRLGYFSDHSEIFSQCAETTKCLNGLLRWLRRCA